MSLIFDIVIAAIIIIVITSATHKGFVSSAFKLLSTAVSFGCAVMFHKQLGAVFYDKFVYKAVSSKVYETVSGLVAQAGEGLDSLLKVPEKLSQFAESLNINIEKVVSDAVNGVLNGANITESVSNTLSDSFSVNISNILAFAAIFIGGLIILSIAQAIINAIFKLPVLSTVNRLLGFAFGVCEAAILGIALSYVISVLAGAYGAVNPEFAGIIEGTHVVKFLAGLCPL